MIYLPFKNKKEMLAHLITKGNKIINLATSEVVFITDNDEMNSNIDLHPPEEFAPYTEPKKKVLYEYVYKHEETGDWFLSAKLFENDATFRESLGGVRHFKRLEPAIEINL